MTDDPKEKRIAVLREWRTFAQQQGHSVPSESDITKIGAAGEIWPPHIDRAAAEPWRATIAFLLKQLKFGMHDPMSQLPDDLYDPAAVPDGAAERRPAPADSGAADNGAIVDALMAWRSTESGRHPVLRSLRNAALRNVVRDGARTAEQIRGHLGADLQRFAPDMAAVIARVAPAVTATPAPPAPTPTTPTPSAASELGRHVAPQPRRRDGTAAPSRSPVDLDGLDFVSYDYSASRRSDIAVRTGPSRTGGLILRWPAIDDPAAVAVYRVVSGDAEAPYSPDRAQVVAVTTDLTCTDDRPFTSVVRHYQVWCHVGGSAGEAADEQPRRHAEAAVVAPVQDADIREDEGRVLGYWTTLPDAERVHVFRIPLRNAAEGLRDPRYRIFGSDQNLTGFVDTTAERGRTFLYEVCVEANVGAASLQSASVTQEVALSALLLPVTDLAVTLNEPAAVNAPASFAGPTTPAGTAAPTLDIAWRPPPGGQVVIHRSVTPPRAGVSQQVVPETALEQAGLTRDTLVRERQKMVDGRAVLQGVPWPAGWSRVYLTPVTIDAGRARVGTTVPVVRVSPVTAARIVERTDRQTVTFAWPEGAAEVLAFRGVRGQDSESARATGRSRMISPEEYSAEGGMHFAGDELTPWYGCSLHLVPVSYSDHRRIAGVATRLDYPGLWRLYYTTDPRRNEEVGVQIYSAFALPPHSRPRFALVHNRGHLPLDLEDGEQLLVWQETDPTRQDYRIVAPGLNRENSPTWVASVKGRSGFLRLFVEVDGDPRKTTVALMDPPVAALRLPLPVVRKGSR